MQLWLPRMLGPSTDPTQSLGSARPTAASKLSLAGEERLSPFPQSDSSKVESLSCAATHSFKGPGGRQRLPGPRGERQVSPPHRLQRSAGRVCRQGRGELRVEVGVGMLMAHRVRVRHRAWCAGGAEGALATLRARR